MLKTWPEYFQEVVNGNKTFDVRKEDDHKFSVGDILFLEEFDPTIGQYTGKVDGFGVMYCMRGKPYVPDGYVIMGIKSLEDIELYVNTKEGEVGE